MQAAQEQTTRILLIEDDDPDYDAGLKAIRSAAHDVCLLDNRLSSRTGLELLDACGGAVAALPTINCYVTKPYDFEACVGVVKTIESFWLSVVKLPAKGRTAALTASGLSTRLAVFLRIDRGRFDRGFDYGYVSAGQRLHIVLAP